MRKGFDLFDDEGWWWISFIYIHHPRTLEARLRDRLWKSYGKPFPSRLQSSKISFLVVNERNHPWFRFRPKPILGFCLPKPTNRNQRKRNLPNSEFLEFLVKNMWINQKKVYRYMKRALLFNYFWNPLSSFCTKGKIFWHEFSVTVILRLCVSWFHPIFVLILIAWLLVLWPAFLNYN